MGSTLELERGEVAQHGVDTFAVVKYCKVGKNFSLGLVAGKQLEVVEVFSLQATLIAFLLGICLGQDGTPRDSAGEFKSSSSEAVSFAGSLGLKTQNTSECRVRQQSPEGAVQTKTDSAVLFKAVGRRMNLDFLGQTSSYRALALQPSSRL